VAAGLRDEGDGVLVGPFDLFVSSASLPINGLEMMGGGRKGGGSNIRLQKYRILLLRLLQLLGGSVVGRPSFGVLLEFGRGR
jgi:hypothetical protein